MIVLIHDLGSFRRKALTVAQEIKRLNHADYIIAHNEKMKKWLEDNGCKAKLGVLEIFKLLIESKATPKPNVRSCTVYYMRRTKRVKNTFLYEVGEISILSVSISMVAYLILTKLRKETF